MVAILLVLLGGLICAQSAETAAQLSVSCRVDDAEACTASLSTITAGPGQSVLVQGEHAAGRVPVVRLRTSSAVARAADWQLVVQRLVLYDVLLQPPAGSLGSSRGPVGPMLWPLNAFTTFGSGLVLQDVRLVLRSTALFQQYLDFFSAQPALQSSVNTTLHTDGRTFVHVTQWASGSTTLQSVTLMTGPCAALFDERRAAGGDLTTALAYDNSTGIGGPQLAVALASGGSSSGTSCNVHTADDQSLVPLLLGQGRVSSRESLLLLLQTNVSIGGARHAALGRIKLGRPVIMAGLWSVPTGVDFLMTPNTLDVTAPLARVAFSSLVLENNPTGDVTTTLVCAPFSPIATVNLYAVFCSRANPLKPCTVLNNVTVLLSSQTEFGYIGHMYTLYNSDAPGAKQLTLFYSQDLMFSSLKFTVGPGHDSITVHNATSVAWRMLDTVFTTRPMLAPPLPLPKQGYVDFEPTKAAALMLQVFNCADLKAALEYRTIPSRLHMLLLRDNLSLLRSSTPQTTHIEPAPTASWPEAFDGPSTVTMSEWPAQQPGPTCLGPKPLVAYRTQIQGSRDNQPILLTAPEVNSNGGLAGAGVPSLAFAYTRNGLVVPGVEPAQLTFQNLLLRELPQGGTPAELMAAAQLPYLLPPNAWTILLFSVNSTLPARALRVRNSAMMLPAPEYRHLAALAGASRAFVIEVAGNVDALSFKDTSQHLHHIHVGMFEGPGIFGENITLLLEADAQSSVSSSSSSYWWPAEYKPAFADDYGAGQPAAGWQTLVLLPAVLVPTVAVVLATAVAAVLLLRRRHRQQLEQLQLEPLSSRDSGKRVGSGATEAGTSVTQSDMSDSHRGSRDGKPPSGSCGVSADPSELRIDVDQLWQTGFPGPSLHTTPPGLPYPVPPSPSRGHALHTSPFGDRAHLYGFFPVIEGVPADCSSGQLPLAVGLCGMGSSSGSSRGVLNSTAGSEVRPSISAGSSAQSIHKQHQHTPRSAAVPVRKPAPSAAPGGSVSSATDLASTVATGLEKWRIAISTTTMQLAERRLAEQQATAMTVGGLQQPGAPGLAMACSEAPATAAASNSSSSGFNDSGAPAPSAPRQPQRQQQQQPQRQRAAAKRQTTDATADKASGFDRSQTSNSHPATSLLLKRVLGRGSFGQVWLGVWRGISVAVKIMHLPTSVLVDAQEQQDQQQPAEPSAVPPHFAIMEAVLSSQCSHPNVVQVYTYMLTPLLTAAQDGCSGDASADGSSTGARDSHLPTIVGEPGLGSRAADVAAAAAAAAAAATNGTTALSGWELKLIMELCDEGTLRTALDKGMLKLNEAAYIAPRVVMLLARDVAAAMLHLHSEGVVHGDLKAANVMLAGGAPDEEGLWGRFGRRLIAKVADFGLAVPLGPSETHASLTARGTPTHMSPELFMSGRVSKACDSFAFGTLLYELVTGQRAFTGVPLPLLPHEVAVKGLRPEWPAGLPAAFWPLQQLAEACWAQDPETRPVFTQIIEAVDAWVGGDASFRPLWQKAVPPGAQQQGPSPLTHSPLAEGQPVLSPAPQLHPQIQQQQHRQWRHTVLHADEKAESPVARNGNLADVHAAAAVARAGQLDWSEVSFEKAHKPAQPN